MTTGSARPPDEDVARVWAQLRAFTDRHSPRHRLREVLGAEVAKGRGKVLALVLLADGPLSLAEIATAQGIDRPYATAIVDQLEALGFAERTTDPDDRRRKLVSLTEAGRAAAGTAREIIAAPPEALRVLSRAELAQLRALLERLLAVPGE